MGFKVFIQLQGVSVTMTYDSSGNVDLHIPHTLVHAICGMCTTPTQVINTLINQLISQLVNKITVVVVREDT